MKREELKPTEQLKQFMEGSFRQALKLVIDCS